MTDVQGKLLIAPPNLPDWRFQKSVIYMWKHNVAGASGIIINKKCDNPKFEQVCREGNIHRNPEINPHIFYGGPVLTNLIGCLHSIDYKKNRKEFTIHEYIIMHKIMFYLQYKKQVCS